MKRLTAILLAIAMLAVFCVPLGAAAVNDPPLEARLVGSLDNSIMLNGQPTLKLEFQVKANKADLILTSTQEISAAFDNTVLALAKANSAEIIDDASFPTGAIDGASVGGAGSMSEVYKDNSGYTVPLTVYAGKSSDGATAYLRLALSKETAAYNCPQEFTTLAYVRLAFRSGKTSENLAPGSIRTMTIEESQLCAQNDGLLLNTTESGGTYKFDAHIEGVATNNDTLNAPKITYPGSIGEIRAANITGFVAPIMGATPIEVGALSMTDEHYTITSITWSPTVASTFAPNTVYAATVVLTAGPSYKFVTLTPTIDADTAPAEGTASADEEGNTLTFAVTFPQTSNRTDVSTTISFEGDDSPTYDRTQKSLTATSTDNTSGNFTYSYVGTDDTTYETSATPPTNAGTYSVTATYESETAIGTKAATLTINKAQLTITNVNATNREYNGTTIVELTDGSLEGVISPDNVTFELGNGTITSADVDTAKPVTTSITLGGTEADNYELTQPTVTVNITQANISGATVVIGGSYTYTGSPIILTEADITVTLGDRPLTPQTDYTFAASENTDAGTPAKLTVTGKGNYTGTKEQNFTIARKGVIASDLTYTIPPSNTYTGQPQGIGEVTGPSGIGTITVYYTGKSGTTYEISTTAPTNAGIYAVTADIAASTNYATASDLALGDYTIAKAQLTITGANIAEKTYDKTTTATVNAVTFSGEQNSEELALTEDYTVSGAAFSAVSAGAGTVTGTVALKSSEKAKNYSLANGALSQSATISPAEYTYEVAETQQIKVGSGLSAITVAPTNGTGVGGEAVAGTLIWHKDNPTGTAAQDNDISALAVEAKVTLYWSFVANDQNYTSEPETGSTEFEIVEGDPQEVAFTTTEAIIKIYGNAEFTNAAANASISGGAVSYESSNSSIATVDAVGKVTILSAGTTTITATAAAVPGTWRETAVYYTLTVNPKTLTDDMLSISGTYTYNGSAQSPSYTVKDGETILAIDTDYTADVLSVTNANKYTLTVTGTGNYSDSVSKDFIISPKTLDNGMLSIDGTYTYDGTAQSPAYTVTDGAALTKGTDYTETALPSATDAGSYTLTVTGKGNYTGTASRTFTIAKADLTSGDISVNLSSVTYDGAVKPVNASILGKSGFGILTIKYGGSTDAPVDADSYAVTADITGGINFNATAGISLGTYTINKASVSGVSQSVNAKEGISKTYTIGVETLLPSNVGAAQVADYTLETATDSYDIIDGTPAINDGILSIPIKDSAAAGQTASIPISFTSANYDISNATVTVNVTEKNPVVISGITVASRAYNGSEIAYDGTPVFTDDSETVELTPVFTWSSGAAAPTDVGNYTLTVSADGRDDYDVSPLIISFEITKANQAISLTAPTINRVGRTEALTSSTTSGLPITFATSDGALATIAGGILELISEGTVTITASQSGDSNYNAAPDAYYTIVILPAASDDATLADLTIGDDIALSPAFEPTETSYEASVGSGVSSVIVSATANHANATVSGDGTKQLSAGPNTIAITVTAEDGTTIKTYTITVTRAQSSGLVSGGGGSTSSPTATAADGSVSISYTQSGGAVTLALTDSKVAELIEKSSGIASIDLTAVTNATSADMPKAALTRFADAALDVEIKLPQGSITLEAAAAASIAEQAGGNVSIALKAVAVSSLNERQREAVGSAPVYDVSVSSGSAAITNFDGGLITIALPYALKAGEIASGVTVWHIDELGNIEKLSTMYDTRTRTVIFTTNHLSLYAIAYEEPAEAVAPWQNPFGDVKAGDWFYGDVEYTVSNGLLRGTGATTFSPNTPMTRAMLVTVLYRLAAPANGANTASFADVPPDEWYSDAVAWAAEIGIVSGVGNNMFAPNAEIKRQDLAALLYRYARLTVDDGQLTADAGVLSGFGDAEAVSEYARDALAWAISAGIIRGNDKDLLNPNGAATRAETAAMLHRFLSE